MSVWDDVVGQEAAVRQLRRAIAEPRSMANSWLLTGPPGSGRSTAARAFAAALQCPDGGCGVCASCHEVRAGTHPDVIVVATDKLSISREQTRAVIGEAHTRPVTGQFKIVLMEDADRMSEGTFNVLLKSLEEPPERTVWLLCAPSPQDLAPTIASRCRQVTLSSPPAEAVADLLVRRDGVDPETALASARAARSHIGVALRLATHPDARERRARVVRSTLDLAGVGQAVLRAGEFVEAATAEAKDSTDELASDERAETLRTLGVAPDAKQIPPAVRSVLKQLEDDQKKRVTRTTRDVLDRMLLDLYSVWRDVLMLQLSTGSDLVNAEYRTQLIRLAEHGTAGATLDRIEAVRTARARIGANVAPLLAVEAAFVRLA